MAEQKIKWSHSTNLNGNTADDAKKVYDQIAKYGGFGSVGGDFIDGPPALDFTGLPTAKQAHIEKMMAAPEAEAPAKKK